MDHGPQSRRRAGRALRRQALFVSKIPVQGVYTFGQPRVGNNDFAAAVHAKLGSGIFRFVNDRDIVPRVPLFTMGFCHYGGHHSFDHDGKASSAESAVESLTEALAFAKVAFINVHAFGKVAVLLKDSFKSAIKGKFTEDHEKAYRDLAIEILRGGVEKIDDHSMEEHYLVRLETTLPSV